jgi:Beta-lactamase
MRALLLSAAIATAVVRDGQTVSIRTSGAPREAAFRMASLSKVVTAYAAMKLVREGRLELDADISRYLGGRPAGVTLRHLLTHTSGIEDAHFGNAVPIGGPIPTLEEHFRERPPVFARPPGAYVVYSNEGYALIGLLIERVTETQFAEYVQRAVFEPLGMTRSTFAQPPPFPVVPSGAEGQALIQAPAGAMVGTVDDMARLLVALLDDPPVHGLFRDGNALFHTGRSGHESVLYLDPSRRLGAFLVTSDGADRTLRQRFIDDVAGPSRPMPRTVRIASGTYKALILPVTRVERLGELATDADVHASGSRITIDLPPFARKTVTFAGGASADGQYLEAARDGFVLKKRLADPVAFVRIPWWRTGRARMLFAFVSGLILLSAVFRAPGAARVLFVLVLVFLAAAPLLFAGNYLPRDAESRPFHVQDSVALATTMFTIASVVACLTPFAAWRASAARNHSLLASGACLVIVLLLHDANLLGWRF